MADGNGSLLCIVKRSWSPVSSRSDWLSICHLPIDTMALTYSVCVFSFIETKLFSAAGEDYLTDDEYARLQAALVERPECGALIPGPGGVRKREAVTVWSRKTSGVGSFTMPRFAMASCLC